MREWKFDNGIEVFEKEHDHDLHIFKVYSGDACLGTVYPDTIGDMEECIEALDSGEDPITGGWEDGCGHSCSLDGWGEDYEN